MRLMVLVVIVIVVVVGVHLDWGGGDKTITGMGWNGC